MKYLNYSRGLKLRMGPKFKADFSNLRSLFSFLFVLMATTAFGQGLCNNTPNTPCNNVASLEADSLNLTTLVCDGTSFDTISVAAGGLYKIKVQEGNTYEFNLTPAGNNLADPIYPGKMNLWHDQSQTTFAASSGIVMASAGSTPTTMSYVDGSTFDNDLFLAIWDKSCDGSWKDYILKVTCTSCALSCDNLVSLAANETGCLSAGSLFPVPTTTGPCDTGTLTISDDGGTGAVILGVNMVSVPAGLATGVYTIEFSVENCAGVASTCSTDVVVAPTSGCVSTNVNLSPVCTTPLTADLLLKNSCTSLDQYTLFIDGVEATSVTEAGTYDVSVKYTPTNNPSISIDLCWAPITFEDKSGPSCSLSNSDTEYNFVCGFETATAVPTFTDCSGNTISSSVSTMMFGDCGEIDGVTMDTDHNLFTDFDAFGFINHMGTIIPKPTEAEADTLYNNGFLLEKIEKITFIATDALGNIGTSCEQFIYYWRPGEIEIPENVYITCGLSTSPNFLASIDPQLVPHYANPLYNANLDNSTLNDFSSIDIHDDPNFISTRIDDNGNPEFVALDSENHTLCKYSVDIGEDRLLEDLCGNTFKILREYTIMDWCTGIILFDEVKQVIKTVDKVAPVFTNCPTGIEVGTISNPDTVRITSSTSCTATFDFSVLGLVATDDCSEPITYSASFFATGSSPSGTGTLVNTVTNPSLTKGNYRVAVTATDECNNISEPCNYFINVHDDVTPTIECKEHLVLSVDNNGNGQICADKYSWAEDNCGNIVSHQVRKMEDGVETFADCVNVSCDDTELDAEGNQVVNLVYRAVDECGNSNTSMCSLKIVVTTPPSFRCPPDVTVECSDYDPFTDIEGVKPTIGGQCGQVFGTRFEDSPLDKGVVCDGSGTITRTYFLTLNGVDITSCTQTITIIDETPPTINQTIPSDVTVECDAIPVKPVDFTATDVCPEGTIISVDVDDVIVEGSCVNEYTITRTFSATDGCNNTATAVQTITVEDNTDPIFGNLPANENVSCAAILIVPTVTATDNCDTDVDVALNEVTTNPSDCPNESTITRTWTAQDNCGNSVVHTQVVNVTSEPITVVRAPDQSVDCAMMDTYVFVAPTVTDSPCGPSNVTISGPVESDMTLATGVIQRTGTFTVTDYCDFSQEYTTTVTFTNCCTEVLFFVDISCSTNPTSIPELLLTAPNASQLDLNSVSFKIADISSIPSTLNTTITPGVSIVIDRGISYTVTVCSIDSDFTICTPKIDTILCDASGRISGRIFNEEFTPLEEVEVELMNTEIPMSMTNEKGEYSFEGLGEQAYTIAAHKEKDPANGISTYDLVVMAQHVLGIQALDSPYKLIAADINMDETIDILDMLELRQLILYSIDDFSVNTSWRFVNANYVFPDLTDPWLETIPELHNLEAPSTDVEHDFIAVKIGDLDCSAETRSNVTDVTPRENKTLVLETTHQTVSAGTTFDVALQPNQDVSLSALQFTLDFDPSLATLVSVASSVLNAKDIAVNEKFAQEGKVPFVWYNQQNVQLDTDQNITLTFEAKRDLDLEDLLDINSSMTKAAAYSSEGIGYKLSFEMLDQLDLNSSAKYTLYQNQPNPFQTETVIGFDVEQDEDVKLTVFNIEGKLLYTAEFTAQAGFNSVVISKEELQSTGVLFYQLDAADYTMTKKMIILE